MQYENSNRAEGQDCGSVYGAAHRVNAVRADSACDHVLPDYMGEVKKLLVTRSRPIPAGSYERDGDCSFSGVVSTVALYSDRENRLCGAEFTSDYDFDVRLGARVSSMNVMSVISSSSLRVTGPRKLSFKCALSSDVTAGEESCVPYPENIDKLHAKRERIDRHVLMLTSGQEREYAEEGERIEGIAPSDIEVIDSDAVIRIDGAYMESGSVTVKGVICACGVLRVLGETVVHTEKEIPFEEIVAEAPGGAEPFVSAFGYVSSVSASVTEPTDQSDGICSSVVFSVSAVLGARLDKNESFEVVTDAFAEGSDSRLTRKRLDYQELEDIAVCECDLKIRSSDVAAGLFKEIIYSDTEVEGVGYETLPDGVKITGLCNVTLLMTGGGDEPFISQRLSSPVEIILKPRTASRERLVISPEISIQSVKTGLDVGGAYADVRLRARATVTSQHSIECIESAEIIPRQSEGENTCISVYYPDEGETLYDVCRRYRRDPRSVARENSILIENENSLFDPELLSGVRSIIISN